MRLMPFNSVKARLLWLLLLISLPVFALILALATINYRSDIRAIEQAQITTADEYAIRTRIWLRGILRSVEVVLLNVASEPDATVECQSLISSILQISPTYKAMQVVTEKSGGCHAAPDNFMSDDDMKSLFIAFRQKTDTPSWIPSISGRFRYDTVRVQNQVYVVVYLRNTTQAGEAVEGMLILKSDLLDQLFELGSSNKATIVGLVANGTDILAVRGTQDSDRTWLPRLWPTPEIPLHWSATSISGLKVHYAARFVAEKDIVVIAYFSGAEQYAALLRFLALAMAPFFILVMMYAASWRFIQTNIVEGIAGIATAAKAEIAGQKAVVVPLDPKMPDDIRNVAEAFNRMVTVASSREESLMTSLQLNQKLMRELHHRVKNSLQVIQSYLSLTRREQPDDGGEILRDAEAKVQVLAVAYRHALTDTGMQPVPLEPFIRELLSSMSDAARRSAQIIIADIRTNASLDVDRAIPLGLAIVEESFACLREPSCRTVRVILESRDIDGLHLTISADADGSVRLKTSRTLLGLKLQLGAHAVAAQSPIALHWQIPVE